MFSALWPSIMHEFTFNLPHWIIKRFFSNHIREFIVESQDFINSGVHGTSATKYTLECITRSLISSSYRIMAADFSNELNSWLQTLIWKFTQPMIHTWFFHIFIHLIHANRLELFLKPVLLLHLYVSTFLAWNWCSNLFKRFFKWKRQALFYMKIILISHGIDSFHRDIFFHKFFTQLLFNTCVSTGI